MEKGSLRLRETTVINWHAHPGISTPVLIAMAMRVWQAANRAGVKPDVLPDTDVSTFAPWTLTRGRLSFDSLQTRRPHSIAKALSLPQSRTPIDD